MIVEPANHPVRFATGDTARLRAAADALEAGFLAEMLTAAGLGKTSGGFGGGVGEEHFASFLVQAQAEEIVRAGGIGLSESLFAALAERRTGA